MRARQNSIISSAVAEAPSFSSTKAHGRLAPLRVRLRHHAATITAGMAVQHVLDFLRGDVLAARDDDVLRAVLDLDVAVGMHHREVAGVEPAAAERLLGGRRVLEVALHRDVAAEHDLAHGLAVARHRLASCPGRAPSCPPAAGRPRPGGRCAAPAPRAAARPTRDAWRTPPPGP